MVASGFYDPVTFSRAVVGECSLVECDRDLTLFTGFEIDLFKTLKLSDRTVDLSHRLAHIDLGNLSSGTATRILNFKINFYLIDLVIDPEITVREGCVRKAVTEGEQHVHRNLVVVSVSHEDRFAVFNCLGSAGEVLTARCIGKSQGECLRELSARIDFTEEDLGAGLSSRFSRQIALKDGVYIVDPGHSDR